MTLNKVTSSGPQSPPELNQEFSVVPPFPSESSKSTVPRTGSYSCKPQTP